MTVRVQLGGIRQVPNGVAVHYARCEVRGVEYQFPLPSQEVANEVVIHPLIEGDEASGAISLRTDKWVVSHLGHKRNIPFVLPDMAAAARVAREFEADPGISWLSDPADLESWAVARWERENTPSGGDR
jgi:hypothetical protein